MEQIVDFERYLRDEEKSGATIEKYLRDVRRFFSYLSEKFGTDAISKKHTIEYKQYLTERYAPASVNSMLIAMNSFFKFCGLQDLCVKLLKIQRQIFSKQEKELSIAEYRRLLNSAKGTRLFYIMRVIGGTGIRVSELRYITVEAVRAGQTRVMSKNKNRMIFLPKDIQAVLKEYIAEKGIKKGCIFITRSGKPIDRSNIWRDMRKLCKKAGIPAKKVFPHNLRHLFARTFYGIDKDVVRLADLLGHCSVNTTRIYIAESGQKHIAGLEKVQKMLTT